MTATSGFNGTAGPGGSADNNHLVNGAGFDRPSEDDIDHYDPHDPECFLLEDEVFPADRPSPTAKQADEEVGLQELQKRINRNPTVGNPQRANL